MLHPSLTSVCLLAAVVPSLVNAHNWVNNPSSRSGGPNTRLPCAARKGGAINFAVAQGQDFALEWTVGHHSSTFTWFAIVSRGNEDKLALNTEAILQEYFDDAPEDAKSSSPNGFAHGKAYEKLHTWWTGGGMKKPTPGVRNSRDDDGSRYTKELTTSDSDYFVRPDDWRCSKGGCKSGASWAQFEYKDVARQRDLRAAYSSTKFPWLLAVAKYEITRPHRPRDYDHALIKFPDGSASGEYIIQYLWRGYYDCFDVVLTAGTVPPIVRSFRTWIKVDHCQYRTFTHHRRRFSRSDHKCTIVPSSGDISQCLQDCKAQARANCDAVNVVPLKNPDLVLFQNDVNVPFSNLNCKENELSAAASPDSLVCYGFTPTDPPEVGPPYTVSDDPRDPVFYSTCYQEETVHVVEGYTPNTTSTEPRWRFGDQCISCADARKHSDVANEIVPTWKLATDCKLCD